MFENQFYDVFVVAGCNGKIGKEITKGALNSQKLVVGIDVNSEAKQELKQYENNNFIYKKCDLSEQCLNEIIGILPQSSHIGIVNCSYPRTPNFGTSAQHLSQKDFGESISLKLATAFNFCKFGNNLSIEGDNCVSVVNFSSIYGFISPRNHLYENTNMDVPVDYAVAKSGIISLTKYFHRKFGRNNLRYNVISPGGVESGQPSQFVEEYTKFTNSSSLMSANSIVGTSLFLCSHLSYSYGGHNFIIDNGFSL